MKFIFYLFTLFDICSFTHDHRLDIYSNKYNFKITFPPDTIFKTQITELRNLTNYYDAWAHAPSDDLFKYVPIESYTTFYNTFLQMADHSKISSINKIMNNVSGNYKIHKNAKIDINREKEIITILIRYAYCLNKVDAYRNCPNPCNNAPCIKIKSGFNKSESSNSHDPNCFVVSDNEVVLSESLSKFKRIADMLKKSYHCHCPEGYFWNKTNDVCQEYNQYCKTHGVCSGRGTCLPKVNKYGPSHECFCLPAFKGSDCQDINNPCQKYDVNPCGNFGCERDPSSLLGYRCNCTTKFKPQSGKKANNNLSKA
jgi:hypothetical protein